MKDSPGAIGRWKGQVEGLRLYSSCQDAVGIDGEAIVFEWKNSQDFHHCLFFKRSRKTWRGRTSSPKSPRTGSSSLSMFYDIEWKTEGENCLSNAEKVKLKRGPRQQGNWCSQKHQGNLCYWKMDHVIGKP